jgi:cell division protein FtsL
MNAITRAYQQQVSISSWLTLLSNTQFMAFAVLIFSVFFSAMGVIYMKDLNRRLFIQSQGLQQGQQHYQVERGQLLLEQSAWATQARVQHLARGQLKMIVPAQQSTRLIRLS